MTLPAVAVALLMLSALAAAQEKPVSNAVTVPDAIDHNRIVIDAEIPLPDGSAQTVRAWVDNGNPDFYISRRVATLLGLSVSCGNTECSAPAPREIKIGGMSIPLAGIKEAKIPLKPVSAAKIIAEGMNVEINVPSTVLRRYDVLIDFPGRKFLIGAPGTLRFQGVSSKVLLNPENGLIQVPSKIQDKKYNLALDVGASTSFLAEDLFEKLASAHPDWPHMTGAVGPANMWGADQETAWKLMRLDRVQFGPLFLTDVPVVSLPKSVLDFFEKRAAVPTEGLIGADMLLNYRVGLDYAHSMIYFDIGRLSNFPEFDVIGLILRPGDNGDFTILGIATFEGKPAVPAGPDGIQPGDQLIGVDGIPVRGSTMGQVWMMLGGTPGQERTLSIERGGKEFTVTSTVRHFLGESPEESKGKKKK